MIEKALKRLAKAADEAEIFAMNSKSTSVRTKKHAIDSFKEKSATGYGIRVIADLRMGFYFTNTLDEKAQDRAIKIAKAAERDEHLTLPERQDYKDASKHRFDISVEEGIEMAGNLVSATKDYKGVRPTSGTISWGTSEITVANTNGIWGEKSESALSAYLGTIADGVEQSTGFHYEVSTRKDIDALEVGAIASSLAKDSLNAKHLTTEKRRLILRPMAVDELIENTLVPSFSADSVQRGRSKLGDLVGKAVFSNINIIDDATLADGLMSEPFDDEGVSAEKTILAENGVLQGFLYDTYTAKKEGVASTGNGVRSAHSTPPGVGPSNFIISGDERIEDEEGTLVIHGLVGAHTANPISGDFSCETRNAFLDGVPIKKAIVAGNIFDLLKKGVKFGDDEKQYSSVRSPSIEIPEIMVVG